MVDALAYYFDAPTQAAVTGPGFIDEGSPVLNPHDNTTATNTDASLERKPGGNSGNGVNTGDNSNDFAIITPANPQDLASPPVP